MPTSNHFSWLHSHAPGNSDTASQDADSVDSEIARSTADDNPELLPWRNRLKGYRLGARLARGRDWIRERHPDQAIASLSTHQTPDDSPTDEVSMPSLENGELQLPASVGLLPERDRFNLVVD